MEPAKLPSCTGEYKIDVCASLVGCYFCSITNFRINYRLQVGEVVTTIPSKLYIIVQFNSKLKMNTKCLYI